MKQLNYHHLHYFYLVAKEGSIAKACQFLHVTPQTVSGQIATLEDYLGVNLFERHGRRLVPSDSGKLVYSYAEDIFNLGHELLQALEPNQQNKKMTFSLGITDVIPKVFTFQFLQPLLESEQGFRLNCKEGRIEQLLADMALNKLDMILADRPIPPGVKIKAYSHKIITSGITFVIAKNQQNQLTGNFPECLNNQNLLLPGEQSTIKHDLLTWFQDNELVPNIVGEFDDSALNTMFGQAGIGIFVTPTVVEEHLLNTYDLSIVGRTKDVQEEIYMISTERKIRHPAVLALLQSIESNIDKRSSIS